MLKDIRKASETKDTDFFCTTRDIFQARLDTYIVKTQEYLASAVIGEIGNNTFDHNWEYAEGQCRGTYFNTDYAGKIILADFGRGLKQSLSVVKDCKSDLEAIKTAFTERLSGRSPEQRGNGLKFVCDTVKEKNWRLYFQSGDSYCIIEDRSVNFAVADFHIAGCLAVLQIRN